MSSETEADAAGVTGKHMASHLPDGGLIVTVSIELRECLLFHFEARLASGSIVLESIWQKLGFCIDGLVQLWGNTEELSLLLKNHIVLVRRPYSLQSR